MLKAYVFPADFPISPRHEEWFAKAGYELAAWQNDGAMTNADVVLLSTPVRCSNQAFVHPENAWKKYLRAHRPNAKIIQIGLLENPTPKDNYLHWFFLPDSLLSLLAKAKPLAEMAFIPPLGFPTQESIWKRFYDGHDKSGFFYYFSYTNMITKAVNERLNKQPANWKAEQEFLKEVELEQYFDICRERWVHYSSYWEAVPFSDAIKTLDKRIHSLSIDPESQKSQMAFITSLAGIEKQLATIEGIFEEIGAYFKN